MITQYEKAKQQKEKIKNGEVLPVLQAVKQIEQMQDALRPFLATYAYHTNDFSLLQQAYLYLAIVNDIPVEHLLHPSIHPNVMAETITLFQDGQALMAEYLQTDDYRKHKQKMNEDDQAALHMIEQHILGHDEDEPLSKE